MLCGCGGVILLRVLRFGLIDYELPSHVVFMLYDMWYVFVVCPRCHGLPVAALRLIGAIDAVRRWLDMSKHVVGL